MKKIKLIAGILFLSILQFCHNKPINENKVGGSYSLHGKDTINVTDLSGKKQGVWYIFDDSHKTIVDTITYKDDRIVK